MKRAYYAPEWFLWFVRLGRGIGAAGHDPTVNVVAKTAEDAAREALAIMAEEWKDEARWHSVQEVRILHAVNGVASAPSSREGGDEG